MKVEHHNLFEALFDFHPREDHTPKENFLTESLTYILRTDVVARDRWLSVLLNVKKIKIATCEIKTRPSEKDLESDTSVYPDLLIEGQLSLPNKAREPFAIYCEHKWDSACDKKQLKTYQRIVEGKGKHARLVFVGANHKQKLDALKCFQKNECTSLLWEEIFSALDAIDPKSTTLKEFLDFMSNKGLSPGQPLTIKRMTDFLQNVDSQESDFKKSLLNFANKLNTNYPWDTIPKRFQANYVGDGYGRVGFRFGTEDYKPAITLGFYYSESNHKVPLVSKKGIDLFLRIEAWPKHNKNIEPALVVLRDMKSDLERTGATVLLKGDQSKWNPYSILMVQVCLADVIDKAETEVDQLKLIHNRLITWLEILFKGGKLERGLKKSGLNSGME